MQQSALTAAVGPEEVHGRRLATVFSGLLLVMLLAALDSTIVATALPTIAADLHDLNHIAWVTTSYLLAQTVVAPLYGKLGDQYGRRVVLQAALVVFLVGSALCGTSQTFWELIGFRALQGLGGGGLMVSAQAAVGDVVSPRQRGRYQGLFGAVFGLAIVIGPLIGGSLTTALSWRWIFYVNLPLGVVALVVLAATLPRPRERTKHQIDFVGTALLAAGLACLVLMVSLGGTTWPWSSPEVYALGAATVAFIVAFAFAERRAAEPVLPQSLLRNDVFVSCSVVSLIIGFAMYGSISFLPLFFQVVRGASPTLSGVQLLPLMAGLLLTSIVGGQVVSRTGKYRAFPIAGTAITAIGLFLLARLEAHTSTAASSLAMFVTGFGLGLAMQVLLVAVQNAVDYELLGVATSGVTLFRNIGGSVGTAIIGTVFATGLASRLRVDFPHASTSAINGSSLGALAKLPPAMHTIYVDAFTSALDRAFLVAAFTAVAGFAASWFIRQLPMRSTIAAPDNLANTLASPRAADSRSELYGALCRVATRPETRRWLAGIARAAGVDLPLCDCWIIVQLLRDPNADLGAVAARVKVPAEVLEPSLNDVVDRGLAECAGSTLVLTAEGQQVAERLVSAARGRLLKLLDGWSPEQDPDLTTLIDRLGADIVPHTGDERALVA